MSYPQEQYGLPAAAGRRHDSGPRTLSSAAVGFVVRWCCYMHTKPMPNSASGQSVRRGTQHAASALHFYPPTATECMIRKTYRLIFIAGIHRANTPQQEHEAGPRAAALISEYPSCKSALSWSRASHPLACLFRAARCSNNSPAN